MARSLWAVWLVVSIAIASLMFQGAGFAQIAGAGEPSSGLEPLGESVEEQGNTSKVQNNPDAYGGAASGSDDPLINFILDGGGAVLSTFKLLAALPLALTNLGFPLWFSGPVGVVVQLAGGWGIIQFVTGRSIR